MLRPRASGPASGLYHRGAYAALDFASRIYELDDVSYTSGGLTSLPGFTFTGASLRTMFDSTGAMTYGPNNLLLQSQTFDNASWSTSGTVTPDARLAPDGTMTADKVASAGSITLSQAITCPSSAIVFSVWAAKDSGATQANRFGIRNNTTATDLVFITLDYDTGAIAYTVGSTGASVVAEAGGWRIAISVTAGFTGGNSLTAYVGFSGASTSGQSAFFWGAQLEAVTYRTTPAAYMPTTSAAYYGPRLVYDPVTLASLGILVEEARTNLCLQSQDFATTWTVGGTVTVNATTSPDGTSNADLITSTGSIAVYQPIVLAATACTYSVYAKKSTGATQANRFGIRNSTTATDLLFITFNYDTGGITYDTGASGATATNVGNGWWRIELTVSSGITSGNTVFPYVGFVGAATSGQAAYFWQAQLEAGTGASSAIVTTSAAVTRAADDATLTVSIAAGTMVSEAYGSINAGLTQMATHVSLSNVDDSTAWVIFGQTNMAGAITAYRRAAGVGVNTGTGSTFAAGTRAKVAMRFGSPSGDAVSVNGATPIAIAAAAAPLVVTQLRIGRWAYDPGYLNNAVARVRLYYPLLPDGNLQSLATL